MNLEEAVNKAKIFTQESGGYYDYIIKLKNVKKENDGWQITLEVGDKYPEKIIVIVDDNGKIIGYDKEAEIK